MLPAASAGASFQVASISGEFHGVMAATTPSGSQPREVEDAGLVDRDDAALDLVGQAAEVMVPLRHVAQLHPHLVDQLAVVAGLDLGEIFGLAGQEIGEAAQ